VAAGRRHSWFLTAEAQIEGQVLLSAPAAITAASCSAWPPQGNMQKHTHKL